MLLNAFQTVAGIYGGLASSRWPIERRRAFQWQRLKQLLQHAYQTVPFYRRHFDEHRFHPRDCLSLADLTKIPLLTKQHLREQGPLDFLSNQVDPAHCLTVATSGSSGAPLQILLAPAGQRAHRVAAWRILFEHGFRWSDTTLEIRMTFGPTHPAQRLGIARKIWLSLLEPPASWVETLNRARPEVLVAGASTLRALADCMPAGGHQPRLIVSDSETLYPADRARIRARLGRDPVDVYGLVELSNFAWECERHDGFHISEDSHIVETVDGELIVTHLDQVDMPILRYRTGDTAVWRPAPCPCGRSLAMLGRIDGRAIDSVVLPSGRTLHWPFFHEILGAFPELRQWRVIQSVDLSVCLQLATAPEQVAAIVRAIETRLPEPLVLRTEVVPAIRLSAGEKFRAVLREVRTQ